ncbi:PREDICTED: protein CYPRO4 [Prunus mume]|uniref:Protein CYPRO4 n=1 Tax=Prunus mume TaxID=102107 RepID=A0ABM0N6E4_PRUMU|nr:PREDICTED: protein CYPRO4 [Prunus mume]
MFQFLPFTKGKATTMGGAPSREDPQLSDSDEEQSEEEEIYEDVEESVEEKRRRSAERGPKTPSSVDEVDAMLKALKLKYNPNVKNPVKLYHFVAGDTPQAKGKWVTSEKLTSYSFRKTSRMEIDNDEDGEEEDKSDEEGGDSWWILSVGDPDKIRAKVKVSDEMQLNGDQRRVDFIACAPTRGVWAMKFYADEDYRAFVAKYKDCLFENTYRYEATDENRVKVYGKDFIGWAKPEVADDSVWEDAEDSLSKSPGSATPLRANEDLREEFEEASNGGIQSLALGALDNSFLVGESGIQVVKNFSHGIQGKGVYVNFDDGGYRGGSSLARSTPRKALLMKAETNMLLMSPMNEGKPHTTGLHQFDIETGKVVTEWKFGKDGTDVTMRDITNDSKGAQLDPSGSTFLGLDDNRLCRWDMRDRKGMVQDLAAASGPVLNWNQGHQFSRGTNFQCFASTGDGSIAVGSLDGKIRLYSSSSMRQAKTAFPGLGSPITHVDVTFDGKWILGTTDTYLILICTIFTDKDGKTKTGFGGRMGNRISAPRLLKLSAVDSHLAGVNNKFRNAQFSWVTENGKQERHLVATVGKFSVIWNFQQVKDGSHECYRHQEGLKSCYCYKIVLKDDSIVDSRFMHDKFAVTDSPEAPLVIATPMKVSSFSISSRRLFSET